MGTETGNDQLKAHLRSRLPGQVHQEIWAWLIVHHAIAALITHAATAADLDSDRISFTQTLRLIRRTATGTATSPARLHRRTTSRRDQHRRPAHPTPP